MVMKGTTQTARILFYGGAALVLVAGGLRFAIPASAGELEAQLIVGTAPGVPGGTASVAISLADDVNDGVSADLDIAYPTDLVEFIPPVNQNCQVAERISSTHIIAGTIPQPGLLRFTVTNTQGLEPLGNGEIAVCDFHVLPGVAAGTAALNVDFAELTGAEGMIPVIGVDGAIIISEATNTPTPTNTPSVIDTPTSTPTGSVVATVTNTVAPTPTATGEISPTATSTSVTVSPTSTNTAGPSPTSTATGATATSTSTVGTPSTPTSTPTGGTRTPTARPSTEDDGCNVVPSGQSSSGGMLALLLAPALLVWARRKRF
jgi:MYXO-CTERM domain-containing protein